MNNNILKYESDVWKTADLLRGSGIKESDFPKYMMPFFVDGRKATRIYGYFGKSKYKRRDR